MAHAQISVNPYGGTDTEDFSQFEQLFNGFIGVAGVLPAQQANFLQLHLRDNALRFYQTLPDATRANVVDSLTALRDHFSNPQLQEVHVLKLEQQKCDLKKDTPENFLVTLQKKAQKAYPTPEIPIPDPIDAAAVNAALEAARHARETAHRQERLDAVRDHRDAQIRRLFVKAMPGWLRAKLMEQPAGNTVQDLCMYARRQLVIRDMCRKEDYPEDGFNEISETVSDNLISALSKLTATQEAMEKQVNEIRTQMNDRDRQEASTSAQRSTNQQTQQQQQEHQHQQNRFPNNNSGFQRGFRGGGRGYQPRQPYSGQYTNEYSPRNHYSRGNNNFRGQYLYQNNFRSGYQGRGGNFRSPYPFPPGNQQQWPRRPSNYQNQNYQNQNYQNQNYQNQNYQNQYPQSNHFQQQSVNQQQATNVDIQAPNGPYMPVIRSTPVLCDTCGYPNHTASQCYMRPKPQGRGQSFPFQNQSKN